MNDDQLRSLVATVTAAAPLPATPDDLGKRDRAELDRVAKKAGVTAQAFIDTLRADRERKAALDAETAGILERLQRRY